MEQNLTEQIKIFWILLFKLMMVLNNHFSWDLARIWNPLILCSRTVPLDG